MTVMTAVIEHRTLDEEIGLRVHQVMFERKVTAQRLAAVVGVSGSVLGRKLRGKVAWSARDVVTVARHLNVSVAYLLGETTTPRPDDPAGAADECAIQDSNLEPTDLAQVVPFPAPTAGRAGQLARLA